MSGLTARDVMRQPVVSIPAAESVVEAVRLMQTRRISSLIVLPRYDGDPFGIITKADVVAKVVAAGRDPQRLHVSEVMSRPVHTVPPDSTMRACAALMMQYRVRRLPVCADNGEPIGIVSDSDVFGALLRLDGQPAPSFSL
jgi:CBS domain-containing protein